MWFLLIFCVIHSATAVRERSESGSISSLFLPDHAYLTIIESTGQKFHLDLNDDRIWLTEIRRFFDTKALLKAIFESWVFETDLFEDIDPKSKLFETENLENPVYAGEFKKRLATLNTMRAQMIGDIVAKRDEVVTKLNDEKNAKLLKILTKLNENISKDQEAKIFSEIKPKIIEIDELINEFVGATNDLAIIKFSQYLVMAKQKSNEFIQRIGNSTRGIRPLRTESDYDKFSNKFAKDILNGAADASQQFKKTWNAKVVGPIEKILKIQKKVLTQILRILHAPKTPKPAKPTDKGVSFRTKHESVPASPIDNFNGMLSDLLVKIMNDYRQKQGDKFETQEIPPGYAFINELNVIVGGNKLMYKQLDKLAQSFDNYEFKLTQTKRKTSDGRNIEFPDDERFNEIQNSIRRYKTAFVNLSSRLGKLCEADSKLKDSFRKVDVECFEFNDDDDLINTLDEIGAKVENIYDDFYYIFDSFSLGKYRSCINLLRVTTNDLDFGNPLRTQVSDSRLQLSRVMATLRNVYERIDVVLERADDLVTDLESAESGLHEKVQKVLDDLETPTGSVETLKPIESDAESSSLIPAANLADDFDKSAKTKHKNILKLDMPKRHEPIKGKSPSRGILKKKISQNFESTLLPPIEFGDSFKERAKSREKSPLLSPRSPSVDSNPAITYDHGTPTFCRSPSGERSLRQVSSKDDLNRGRRRLR